MAIHIIFFCRSRILSIQCPPLQRTGWSICPPTFPICIFIITTTNLDDECNPKLFDRPESLSGFFWKYRNVVVFQCPLFIFSKCCFGFTLEEWSYWSPKLGKWATVQLAVHQFYEFSMLTQFAADFDHRLQSVWHSHHKFFPPIKLVISFYCIYLISFLKLISVWIDSEPNSCQWNSTLAHWGCHINKRTI